MPRVNLEAIAGRLDRDIVARMARAIILAAALLGCGLALLLPAPPASATIPCPTSEYSLTFEDGSTDLTELSEEALGSLVARARMCTEIRLELCSFGSDQELALERTHVVHAAIMRQTEVVTETRIVRCSIAATGRQEGVTATIRFDGSGRSTTSPASSPRG